MKGIEQLKEFNRWDYDTTKDFIDAVEDDMMRQRKLLEGVRYNPRTFPKPRYRHKRGHLPLLVRGT